MRRWGSARGSEEGQYRGGAVRRCPSPHLTTAPVPLLIPQAAAKTESLSCYGCVSSLKRSFFKKLVCQKEEHLMCHRICLCPFLIIPQAVAKTVAEVFTEHAGGPQACRSPVHST